MQELSVGPGVDNDGRKAVEQKPQHDRHDAVAHRDEQHGGLQHLLDDLEVQEDAAVPGGLDGVEIGRVQGPEGVVQAEQLHIGHRRHPLFRQQQPHQGLCAHGQPRHQRHEYIGAHPDSPARHLPHAPDVVLFARKDRQQHAVKGRVHVFHDEVRKLLGPVVVGEIGRGVAQADDELVEL